MQKSVALFTNQRSKQYTLCKVKLMCMDNILWIILSAFHVPFSHSHSLVYFLFLCSAYALNMLHWVALSTAANKVHISYVIFITNQYWLTNNNNDKSLTRSANILFHVLPSSDFYVGMLRRMRRRRWKEFFFTFIHLQFKCWPWQYWAKYSNAILQSLRAYCLVEWYFTIYMYYDV